MRRVVVTTLTLALVAAPLGAGAQAVKMPRIGYLSLGAAVPPNILVERLHEAGYVDGQNVGIEYRFGEGRHDAMGHSPASWSLSTWTSSWQSGTKRWWRPRRRRRASRSSCSLAMRWWWGSSIALRDLGATSPVRLV